MLQIADLNEYTESNIDSLFNLIQPVLTKRQMLHERYSRGATMEMPMYSGTEKDTKVPFERYIVDLSAGYLSGKPIYSVNISADDKRNKIIKELLDKETRDQEYAKKMEIIMGFVSDYNDDEQENHDLRHDLLEYGACYEIIYESEENEIVYSKYDPLNTVATWDYSSPANLTGLVRTWMEQNISGEVVRMIELTDINGSRTYEIGKKVVLKELHNHYWNDVPAFAVETDFALFEPCEDLISAYEQLIQNTRNTDQYNDADCKLKITGYIPENPMTVVNEKGETVANPARKKEDELWMKAKTIYVGPDGDVGWLSKPSDASGTESKLKMYSDMIFLMAGVPNASDLAFNSSEMNASAIDRKFYVMNMMTEITTSLLKKAYLRRWELVFNRINLKKGTDFDFRDITIELPKNLPDNSDETIDRTLKLKDTISDQTVIERLGFDYYSEKQKMEEESQDNMQKNIEMMKKMKESGVDDEQSEDSGGKMEDPGQRTEERISETEKGLQRNS